MTPFFEHEQFTLHVGDAAAVCETLPAEAMDCIVTSPPYWGLRDYGVDGQLGLETTPEEYVERLVTQLRAARRVLRSDGTLWLNLGDSSAHGGHGGCGARDPARWPKQSRNDHMPVHAKRTRKAWGKHAGAEGAHPKRRNTAPTLKPKDLVGIPWMTAFALRADGWYLRSEIIWAKPNPMPESVTDRPTRSHEHLFLLSRSEHYFYDHKAVQEPAVEKAAGNKARKFRAAHGGNPALNGAHQGFSVPWAGETRNMRDVWTIAHERFEGAHFATFPAALVTPCILAGSRRGGAVLDCFSGAATTGVVATALGRKYVGIELKPAYAEMSRDRLLDATAQGRLFG